MRVHAGDTRFVVIGIVVGQLCTFLESRLELGCELFGTDGAGYQGVNPELNDETQRPLFRPNPRLETPDEGRVPQSVFPDLGRSVAHSTIHTP